MKYYVNKNAQPTGEHEVHTENCIYRTIGDNMMCLGDFIYASSAIAEAKKYYNNVDGCYYCLNQHHKK